MKIIKTLKIALLLLVAQLAAHTSMAQLNCDGVTNMYGIFLDQDRNNGNTYVSPINFSTAAIGPAIGGVFVIPVAGTGGGNNAFGSTTLGVQAGTNRLFYMTGDYMSKDLYGFNTTAPATKVKISDDLGVAANPYWFVKMAVSTDGYIYSLSTKRISPLADTVNGDTKLIRFNSCLTANCAVTQVMARIPKSSFDPFDLYNGDIAFDVYGDMYIFGSKLNPVNNRYVRAGIYRIKKADIPLAPGTTNIPITKIGDIPAMDSVSITGVAFDGNGNFYLSAVDTVAGQRNRSHIFRGSVIGPTTAVTKMYENIIPGYIIGDLASCTYPLLSLVDAATAKLNGFSKGDANALVWKMDGIKNVTKFVIQRQLKNETAFRNVAEIAASPSTLEYNFSDYLPLTTSPSSNYRVRFEKKDGSVVYTNTVHIEQKDKSKTKVTLNANPFRQHLQFDLSTVSAGMKQVTIFDVNGVQVLNEKIQVLSGMNKIILDKTGSFIRGMYILHVSDETSSQQFKVVKD